ncbi:MAG: hypothetical protein RBU28_08590 [Bacteroidales bacterium]|jgi:hypothetical protein|nr:hypothetical protein [Bacteroidales bacterium]
MRCNSCIFCGDNLSGERSCEHIFPKWALEYFKIGSHEITPTHRSESNGDIVSTRKHSLKNLVAGRICRKCNNGWMSDLESSAKKIVIDLAESHIKVEALTHDERVILARWVFKTVLCLNWGSNFHKNIPRSHYRHLYQFNDSLPERVMVVGQLHQNNSYPFDWLQGSIYHMTSSRKNYNDKQAEQLKEFLQKRAYKIGIQIKDLLLLVAYNPLKNFLYCIYKGIHCPLYPDSGEIGWSEPDEYLFNEKVPILMRFSVGLRLADSDTLKVK